MKAVRIGMENINTIAFLLSYIGFDSSFVFDNTPTLNVTQECPPADFEHESPSAAALIYPSSTSSTFTPLTDKARIDGTAAEDVANEVCEFVITDLPSVLGPAGDHASVSSTTQEEGTSRGAEDTDIPELSAFSSFDPFSGISISTPAK